MPRKPQQPRAQATFNAIVEAGFISLARNGVENTTTRHIADIAGVSVGSLYEYFANKEEVFDAMHGHMVREVVGMVRPLIPTLVRMDIRELVAELLYRFRDLLERDDAQHHGEDPAEGPEGDEREEERQDRHDQRRDRQAVRSRRRLRVALLLAPLGLPRRLLLAPLGLRGGLLLPRRVLGRLLGARTGGPVLGPLGAVPVALLAGDLGVRVPVGRRQVAHRVPLDDVLALWGDILPDDARRTGQPARRDPVVSSVTSTTSASPSRR